MARELTLVDAGLGNLGSVERALIQVGASVRITADPEEVRNSHIVVFPGQGAFSAHTDEIVNGALGEALREVIARGDQFLGICLGMQLLYQGSDEGGGRVGLGVLNGRCVRFPNNVVDPSTGHRLKVPHMGWNDVQPAGDHYYFVHSYYIDDPTDSDLMWSCEYAGIRFPAAIRRENLYACQFHPEKSQQAGLRFLRGFLLGGRG